MNSAVSDAEVVACLPMVKSIARRMRCAKTLPPSVTADDLVSSGMLGLVASALRFNPAHHASLKTFAAYRVRGAMLDYLREASPLSIDHYKDAKAGIASMPFQHSLDEVPEPAERSVDLDARILGSRLTAVIMALSTRERYIIAAYFFKDLTHKEIAVHLNVNPSRVSQLLTRAIQRIRAAIARSKGTST